MKPARAAVLLAALLSASCTTAGRVGVYHPVGPGESAWRIARAYDVDLAALLEANGFPDPSLLRPGHFLWIPGATERRAVPTEPPPRDASGPLARRGFRMPLEGRISSPFGGRGGRTHRGVDILAPEGTPVRAAAAGLILYAGDALRGYGNVVILDHGEGITSLYGHLKEFRVESGDAVAAGALIGTVGKTGNASTHHLHFEIRIEDTSIDPLQITGPADGER